jgi:broad specificity phosphatase PhoE
MKIYILRHEDRTRDCTFFSPLTFLGLQRANELVPILDECNIDLIISSPFIRTLQTIYPYSSHKNIKINLEYGLSDIHHPDIIPKKSVGINLPEYLCLKYNYNCVYQSIIPHTKIKYPETFNDITARIKKILSIIINKYHNSKANIILVTHQSICCAILQIMNDSKLFNDTINTYTLHNYEKGKLSLVYDNGWCFKEIN